MAALFYEVGVRHFHAKAVGGHSFFFPVVEWMGKY